MDRDIESGLGGPDGESSSQTQDIASSGSSPIISVRSSPARDGFSSESLPAVSSGESSAIGDVVSIGVGSAVGGIVSSGDNSETKDVVGSERSSPNRGIESSRSSSTGASGSSVSSPTEEMVTCSSSPAPANTAARSDFMSMIPDGRVRTARRYPPACSAPLTAARAVFAAASKLFDEICETEEQTMAARMTEEVAEALEGELSTDLSSESDISNKSLDFVSELTQALKKTRKTAGIAREYAVYCRRLLRTVDESLRILKRSHEYFLERSTLRSLEKENYVSLAELYDTSFKILKKRSGPMRRFVDELEMEVADVEKIVAEASEIPVGTVAFSIHHPKKVSLCIYRSSLHKYSFQNCHVAEDTLLRYMRRIWKKLMDNTPMLVVPFVEPESSDSESTEEASQECENRERKTKVVHVAGLVVGAAMMVAAFTLFRMGSDSFYAILCLGTLMLGWTVLYWGIKLYRNCKRPVETKEAEADSESEEEETPYTPGLNFKYLIQERLGQVREYLRRHKVYLDAYSDSVPEEDWLE